MTLISEAKIFFQSTYILHSCAGKKKVLLSHNYSECKGTHVNSRTKQEVKLELATKLVPEL